MIIKLQNADGWEKTVSFDKTIVRIGSAATCDLVLSGSDIAPLQCQLMLPDSALSLCTIFNIAEGTILKRGSLLIDLDAGKKNYMLGQDQLLIGEFDLTLSDDSDTNFHKATDHMEAELVLRSNTLTPEEPISGLFTVHNTGTEKSCQFSLKARGLPEECVMIEPIPLLYPGARESIGILITHRETTPSPGLHKLTLTLSAHSDYFGEFAVFNQNIYVSALIRNEYSIEDDLSGLRAEQKARAEALMNQSDVPDQPPSEAVPPAVRPDSAAALFTGINPPELKGKVPVVSKSSVNAEPPTPVEQSEPALAETIRQTPAKASRTVISDVPVVLAEVTEAPMEEEHTAVEVVQNTISEENAAADETPTVPLTEKIGPADKPAEDHNSSDVESEPTKEEEKDVPSDAAEIQEPPVAPEPVRKVFGNLSIPVFDQKDSRLVDSLFDEPEKPVVEKPIRVVRGDKDKAWDEGQFDGK